MENILISGGSGFVGSHLTEVLIQYNFKIFILTRNKTNKPEHPNVTYIEWLTPECRPEDELPNIDAVINLAGETINGRWTDEKKEKILHSRLEATNALLFLMNKLTDKPSLWINASAVGYYGTSETDIFTEETVQHGDDFLAKVVKAWETKAREAKSMGCRTVFMRFGVILGKDGGALPRLVMPYRLFAGGTVGSGKQWVSWVHIDDVCFLIKEVITNPAYEGPVNVTAPHPVTMKEFGQVIADVTKRPHWLPAPAITFRLLLGEMSMLILKGQHVLPETALNNGYHFKFPHIKGALQHLIQ
jgi:uncharacterized protein